VRLETAIGIVHDAEGLTFAELEQAFTRDQLFQAIGTIRQSALHDDALARELAEGIRVVMERGIKNQRKEAK
jgi:cyanate lyase